MSRERDRARIELIRACREGKTLVMVEHDMGVVFDLADRISVLVYGEIIATDTPARIRANAAVQEAYLGDGAGCLKSTTCTPTTARATSCTASTFTSAQGEIVEPARTQRRGPLDAR